jgi:hypothetical protein
MVQRFDILGTGLMKPHDVAKKVQLVSNGDDAGQPSALEVFSCNLGFHSSEHSDPHKRPYAPREDKKFPFLS